jgi:hypothetical protein
MLAYKQMVAQKIKNSWAARVAAVLTLMHTFFICILATDTQFFTISIL